jgi:hypothetical protein
MKHQQLERATLRVYVREARREGGGERERKTIHLLLNISASQQNPHQQVNHAFFLLTAVGKGLRN